MIGLFLAAVIGFPMSTVIGDMATGVVLAVLGLVIWGAKRGLEREVNHALAQPDDTEVTRLQNKYRRR